MKKTAHTRVELLLVTMVLAVVTLAAISIPRISRNSAAAKARACRTNVVMMDTQIEAYYSENNFWPIPLADFINDSNYFPRGAPVCPSGGRYTVDSATHRVSCSIHGH